MLDELHEVQKEAKRAKIMHSTCNELSEKIKSLESEHQSVTDELNRYQSRNDQLIKQNKVGIWRCFKN